MSKHLQNSLVRPDRKPCDPADLGLDADCNLAKANRLVSLKLERVNLDDQSRFFRDFGLTASELSQSHRTYYCETGAMPLVEVTKADHNRLAGLTFALSASEFERAEKAAAQISIASTPDAIEVPAPGQLTLRLTRNPDKAFGKPSSPVAATRGANQENDRWIAPSRVMKLGHVVLQSRDPLAAVRFYRKWLGLIPTDVQVLPSGRPVVIFLRLDLGDEPADHHTLVIAQSYKDGFDHAAFETASLDEVGFGHQHLKAKGWRHSWGIGRHWLGGQLFDYWRDPAGAHFEHYADSDTYTSKHPSQITEFSRASLYSWGDDLPTSFTGRPKLSELPGILRDIRKGDLNWTVLREMQAAAKVAPRSWLK